MRHIMRAALAISILFGGAVFTRAQSTYGTILGSIQG